MDRKDVAIGMLLGVIAVGSLAWTSREIPPPTPAPMAAGCSADSWMRLPAVESGQVAQAHPQGAPGEMVFLFQCWNGSWQAVATF